MKLFATISYLLFLLYVECITCIPRKKETPFAPLVFIPKCDGRPVVKDASGIRFIIFFVITMNKEKLKINLIKKNIINYLEIIRSMGARKII